MPRKDKGPCVIVGCEKPAHSRGMCQAHYYHWNKNNPDKVKHYNKRGAECCVDGCDRPVVAVGMCKMHRRRLMNTGNVGSAAAKYIHGAPPEARFWPKVEKNGPPSPHRPDLGPCWVWTAGTDSFGYGSFSGPETRAHRMSWVLLVGPIPDGLVVDHLCHIRRCVNPLHLQLTTLNKNSQRQIKPTRTHCKNGHALIDDNVTLTNGRRQCRTCQAQKLRILYWSNVETKRTYHRDKMRQRREAERTRGTF